MAGDHDTLARLAFCEDGRNLEQQTILRNALHWVLSNQYVRCPELHNCTYHFRQGSGMGLRVSDAVANKAFYEFGERGVINRATLQLHQVWHDCIDTSS